MRLIFSYSPDTKYSRISDVYVQECFVWAATVFFFFFFFLIGINLLYVLIAI